MCACPFSSLPLSKMVSELEKAVRADLQALIKEKNCHGIMVRVGWHDAGTSWLLEYWEWGGARGSGLLQAAYCCGLGWEGVGFMRQLPPSGICFAAGDASCLLKMCVARCTRRTGWKLALCGTLSFDFARLTLLSACCRGSCPTACLVFAFCALSLWSTGSCANWTLLPAPLFVVLSVPSLELPAGTYSKEDGTGGSNGTQRFAPESAHGANTGLDIARAFCDDIKAKHPEISYADLYQLASIVAIEDAGGPVIPFRMGRKDAEAPMCTPDGRLPDADKRMPHLRDVFYRMGFNDAEIVVLSGAHTLGAAHKDRSGFDGPWTSNPNTFDNSYFKEILKEAPAPGLLHLPSDKALLDEPECKALVETYASDQAKFFEDYAKAHQKLSELGAVWA